MTGSFDAIVLAGGRGSRLGGIDKAALDLGEGRLVDRTVIAARTAGADLVIVAGPPHAGALADRVVREDPPFSGPLAAIGAALKAATAPWIVLLACDLVDPDATAAELTAARRSLREQVGLILVDASGHPQWLAACVRTDALAAAIRRAEEEEGSLADLPLRAVLGPLELLRVVASAGSTEDIDTPNHLVRARASQRKAER